MVPSEAPWPEDAWGINLGKRVLTIRNQEIYVKDRPDRVAELNRIGFIWDNKNRGLGAANTEVTASLQGAARELGAYKNVSARSRRGPRKHGASTSAIYLTTSATGRSWPGSQNVLNFPHLNPDRVHLVPKFRWCL